MVQHSSISQIIWSMLFVAGALWCSYMIAWGGGGVLLWPTDIGQASAEVITEEGGSDRMIPGLSRISPAQQVGGEDVLDQESDESYEQDQVISLSQIVNTTNQYQDVDVGEDGVFETPESVAVGGNEFFSVQQLFAETGVEGVGSYQTLPLKNTYQRQNNGNFILPESVGVDTAVQYILKDPKNTHYVYLGDYQPGVFDMLGEGNTVVAIEDKVSINRSGFFGDRVWLFSIAEYEARQKIIALIRLDAEQDTWLLQIDRDWFVSDGQQVLYDSFAEWYRL